MLFLGMAYFINQKDQSGLQQTWAHKANTPNTWTKPSAAHSKKADLTAPSSGNEKQLESGTPKVAKVRTQGQLLQAN